jgi:hypothetical protein
MTDAWAGCSPSGIHHGLSDPVNFSQTPQVWYAGEAGGISVSGTDMDNLTADGRSSRMTAVLKPYPITRPARSQERRQSDLPGEGTV